ncbi:hypothetical protein ACTXT7_016870 [Hymenolepis weldensis]
MRCLISPHRINDLPKTNKTYEPFSSGKTESYVEQVETNEMGKEEGIDGGIGRKEEASVLRLRETVEMRESSLAEILIPELLTILTTPQNRKESLGRSSGS